MVQTYVIYSRRRFRQNAHVIRRIAAVVLCTLVTFASQAVALSQTRHPWTIPGTLRIGTNYVVYAMSH